MDKRAVVGRVLGIRKGTEKVDLPGSLDTRLVTDATDKQFNGFAFHILLTRQWVEAMCCCAGHTFLTLIELRDPLSDPAAGEMKPELAEVGFGGAHGLDFDPGGERVDPGGAADG